MEKDAPNRKFERENLFLLLLPIKVGILAILFLDFKYYPCQQYRIGIISLVGDGSVFSSEKISLDEPHH